MSGDAHVRHCGRCAKNVYDLSSLTRDQAERLLEEREGELCVRFYRRPDGTVMTSDCAPGQRRRRLRGAALAATVAAGVGGYVAQRAAERHEVEAYDVMGMMPLEVERNEAEVVMGAPAPEWRDETELPVPGASESPDVAVPPTEPESTD